VNRTLPASLFVLFAALVGCSTPAAPASAPPPAPAPVTPAARAQAHTAEQQAFLDRLLTIDPDLVDTPDQVIGRGVNSCSELDKPEDIRVQNTVARFSGAVPVTPDQARKILDPAQATVCKNR
jgi:hypothetical protein